MFTHKSKINMSEILKNTEPAYTSYWNDRSELARTPEDAEFFSRQHQDFVDLTNGAVRQGKSAHFENPNVGDGILENTRAWVHMLGPDSSLAGAHDDLMLATQRLIANINHTKDPLTRQQVFLEAATTLIGAGRQEKSFEARETTRKNAYELLSGVFENDSSYRWNLEDTGYLVDAEMIKGDLRFENLVDQYDSGGFADYGEFEERYVHTHMESLERLKALAQFDHGSETGSISSGKLYEFFYLQANRHLLLMESSQTEPLIATHHMRAALANEDSPWIKLAHENEDSNEGFDVVTEVVENSSFKLLVKDQLKSRSDYSRYAADINVHSFDISEFGDERFKQLVGHAADIMIHQAKAKIDQRIKVSRQDLEELEKVLELTDINVYH
jgi:hypothetical protein